MTISIDGRVVPQIDGLKPRSVLAWLLLHPGPHARSRLAARFWPDVLETSARASLRSALWTIRAALDAVDAADCVAGDRATAGIPSDLPRQIDTEEFLRLADSTEPAALEQAIELAAAALLEDLADDWVLEARDELADRVADVALRRAALAEDAGDADGAIAWTKRALVHARLSEAVHRLLIQRLAASGERAEALAAYKRCKTIMFAEFGVGVSSETRELAARLRDKNGPPARVDVRDRGHALVIPFVGRACELEALETAWAAATGGAGRLIEVSGPGGIGKTRLTEELASHAAAAGGLVATGRALTLPGAPPFAAWADVLRQIVRAIPRPATSASWPASLARLCSAVESAWGIEAAPPASTPQLERARLFDAAVECLVVASADRPLLVILDDAHQADTSSLALLAALAPAIVDRCILVIVTARDVPDTQLAVALDAVARSGALGDAVRLAPLRDRDISAIAHARAPDLGRADLRRIVQAAEGNPLIGTQAADAVTAGTDLTDGLRGWVRPALERLSSNARGLVELTAALARPLSTGEAADLIGADALSAVLEDARSSDLLVPTHDRTLWFRHSLIRDACYAEIDTPRRALLHRELAEMLRARSPSPVAEVGRHLALAGDSEAARTHLAAAASQARALGALDVAASFLREAAEVAATGVASAELWLELADVEAWRGNRAGYDVGFERAFDLLQAERNPARVIDAYLTRGRCLRTVLCYPQEAMDAYRRAVELIDAHMLNLPEAKVLALTGLAWSEAMIGDPAAAEVLCDDAAGRPETAADPVLACDVELARAAALMRTGAFEASEDHSKAAQRLALSAGRVDLACTAALEAAAAAAVRGQFERVLEIGEEALGAGDPGRSLRSQVMAACAYALSRLDRHDQAVLRILAAADEVAATSELDYQTHYAFDVGTIALAAGRWDLASERLEAALAESSARLPRATGRLRLVEARLRLQGPDDAAAELARVPFEPVTASDLPDALVPRLERLEGLIAAERGEIETALRRLDDAARGWRRLIERAWSSDPFAAAYVDLGRPPVAGLVEPHRELAQVLRERAVLLAAEGRHDEAGPCASEADELLPAPR